MQKFLLIILLLSGVGTYAQKEPFVVKGKIITTSKSGEEIGVPGVKLKWVKNKELGLSDISGDFAIKAKSLPDTLIISYTGFQTIYFNITDTSTNFTFNLKEGLVLNGVEVIAKNVGKNIDLLDPRHIETIGSGELRKAACCNL